MRNLLTCAFLSLVMAGCDSDKITKEPAKTELTKSSFNLNTTSGNDGDINRLSESYLLMYSENHPESTLIELRTVSDEGCEFDRWNGGCANTSGSSCSLDVNRYSDIAAIFTPLSITEKQVVPTVKLTTTDTTITKNMLNLSSTLTGNTIAEVTWICNLGCVGNSIANGIQNWTIDRIVLSLGNIIQLQAMDNLGNITSQDLTVFRINELSMDAYKPPIGIPDLGGSDPITNQRYGWGDTHPITSQAPAAPENWNQGIAGFYYINPSHLNASDNNSIYPDKPLLTIPTTVEPGSYIELYGNYDEKNLVINAPLNSHAGFAAKTQAIFLFQQVALNLRAHPTLLLKA